MIKLLKAGIAIYAAAYAVMKLLPTGRKVVFLSRQSNRPSLDFSLLEEEIHRTHPDYNTVMLCRMIGPGKLRSLLYCFHIFRQCYHLATSEIAILDSYCIPACCLRHKDDLLIVQIWHSVGTMKKNGYSVLDQPEGSSSEMAKAMHMHENYDYIFASGEAYKPYLAEAFNQPEEKIITRALPRIQLLKDAEYGKRKRSEIFRRYPGLKDDGRKKIVYCPTFRKGEDPGIFAHAISELITHIDSERYDLILKIHPLQQGLDLSQISGSKNVFVDKEFSTYDMLFVADMAISDYSCVVYEAAVLDMPVYFYAYDFDTYVTRRGMYIDYEKEMPSPIARTAEQLAQEIEKPYDMARLAAFRDKYISPENKNETERMVSFIFDHRK